MSNFSFTSLDLVQCRLLKAFVKYGVDFLVVGGYAMRHHGHERETKDLDLVISQSKTNLIAIDFAINSLPEIPPVLPSEILKHAQSKLKYFNVEVFASMQGLDYEIMRSTAVFALWADLSIPVINLDWLKHSKQLALAEPERLSKKSTDLDDLTFLERLATPD